MRLGAQAAIIRGVAYAAKTAAGCVLTAPLAGMYLPAALILDRGMTAVNEQLAIAATADRGKAPPKGGFISSWQVC